MGTRDRHKHDLVGGQQGANAVDHPGAQQRPTPLGLIEDGLDAALGHAERKFLYMPLMHSEVLADQERFYASGARAAHLPIEAELFVPALGCGLWVQHSAAPRP